MLVMHSQIPTPVHSLPGWKGYVVRAGNDAILGTMYMSRVERNKPNSLWLDPFATRLRIQR